MDIDTASGTERPPLAGVTPAPLSAPTNAPSALPNAPSNALSNAPPNAPSAASGPGANGGSLGAPMLTPVASDVSPVPIDFPLPENVASPAVVPVAGPIVGPDGRLLLEPMDPKLTSIQPGGGPIFRLELAWGRLRRWYLKTFRPRYLVRMRMKRRGDFNGCPHEVLDPRDVKFFSNQGGYYWRPQDDPFTWRDRLAFARVGLAELIVIGGGSLLAAILLFVIALRAPFPAGLAITCALLAVAYAVLGGFVVSFFRDPRREVPIGAGLIVSPADGTIVEVAEVADDFIGGRAMKISIFLSIFNVHINRMPAPGRIIGLSYRRGKMLDARRAEAAEQNEQLAVRIETTGECRVPSGDGKQNKLSGTFSVGTGSAYGQTKPAESGSPLDPPPRRMIVRQITGLIARRIVCWLKPGDVLAAGERFGMIKFGSRTELVIPCETGLEITVKKGDKVQAGSTIVARYPVSPAVGGTS
jgi:phosphatidylserine decarboxylase